MYIDLANTEHSWRAMHRLYLSFVQPRPIAFASTIDEQGRSNLAPFSFYNMLSANPPIVVFSPALNRHGKPKDTLRNIQATGEFVIATVSEPIAERMNICSTEFEHGVSEFEKSGLTPVPARKVRPALVKESPVNIECRLREIISLGERSPSIASVLRITRSSMIQALSSESVNFLRVMGTSERSIVWKHALRNALIPTITVIATSTGWLISGLVVIEFVFSYPGLGRLLMFAIENRDLPLIQAVTMVTVVIILVANFSADLLYALLNPRISYE